MRDAQADIARRIWSACPHCADQRDCADCQAGRSCESHWRFLVAARGRHLFVQCPGCSHRWWHDTRFGDGDRPPTVEELPGFPTQGHTAA
jgi:hypothetical protein